MPLPSSATESEQSIFEKQALVKAPQVSADDTKEVSEEDSKSVHSESDNEGVSSVIESVDVVDKVINKSDEIDVDHKKLLETDIDRIDDEITEILREKSVERDEKLNSMSDDATSINKISDETVKNIIEEKEQVIERDEAPVKAVSEDPDTTKAETEQPKETIIDEDLLPKEAIKDFLAAQTLDSTKPPVPIQTYLWEDVKRSKEQVSGDNVCSPVAPFLKTHTFFYSSLVHATAIYNCFSFHFSLFLFLFPLNY